MITPAIALENFGGEILFSVRPNNFKVLNPTCVKVTADSHRSQGQPQIMCQEHPTESTW